MKGKPEIESIGQYRGYYPSWWAYEVWWDDPVTKEPRHARAIACTSLSPAAFEAEMNRMLVGFVERVRFIEVHPVPYRRRKRLWIQYYRGRD